METLWQDLRYTLRLMRQRPGYTAIAVLTLALGIGATTTIFTIADAVIFRPLPFRDSGRLVEIWNSLPNRKMFYPRLPAEGLKEWRAQDSLFEGMEGYDVSSVVLTGGEEPEQVQAAYTTPGLFPFLGVAPQLGRGFTEEDGKTGAARVVILSHSLWQRRFGGDPAAVGKEINIGTDAYTVVGVMAPTFRFPLEATRLWIPHSIDAAPAASASQTASQTGGRPRALHAITRLRPGLGLETAEAQAEAIAKRLDQERPRADGSWMVRLQSFEGMRAEAQQRRALWVLLGAVGFVLLIACVNTANLMLAQTSTRGREIAIRAALGAQRFRLIRQMLTESALLSLAGGAVGVLGALWGVDLLTRMLPRQITFYNYNPIGVDLRVMTFALGVSLLTGLLFGVLPALRGSRVDLNEALKGAGRTVSGGRRQRLLRQGLIALELALSLVLLAGAGLLANSFLRMLGVDPGFRVDNLLAVEIQLPRAKAPTGVQEEEFFRQVVERVAPLPGVQAVTTAMGVPPQTGIQFGDLQAEGKERTMDVDLSFNRVAPDYFRVMGARLLHGRSFTPADVTESPRVTIINETLARHLYPEGDAVGRRWRLGTEDTDPWYEIVGVVGDIKDNGIQTRVKPFSAYYPFVTGNRTFRMRTLLVRSDGDPMALVPAIKSRIWSVEKDQPIGRINTVEGLFYESLAQPRFYLLLMSLFAVAAIVLAAIGVYGVISYAVSQRTQEIGIRMALGAERRDIIRLVVGQGMAPLAAGLAAGLAGTLALTRYLRSMLYGVSPYDPTTIAAVIALLALAAIAACLLPARRATRVDPLVALRYE